MKIYNAEEIIKVDHLSKSFERDDATIKVIDDVSFSVKRGELICIVGASGCGKSTMLRGIACLDVNHEGTITVNGRNVTGVDKSVGMVFQEHRLFPWLSVEDNIKYALNDKSKEEKKELADKYIKLVNLQGFEKALPKELSGGMSQRAGIARALVNTPPVLLLDEPFGALDTFTKISLQKELKNIQKESETTMILVTHDIEEAVFLADRIIVLSSRPGRIKNIFESNLPEPRNRNSLDFLNLKKVIYEQFFIEEFAHEEYNI